MNFHIKLNVGAIVMKSDWDWLLNDQYYSHNSQWTNSSIVNMTNLTSSTCPHHQNKQLNIISAIFWTLKLSLFLLRSFSIQDKHFCLWLVSFTRFFVRSLYFCCFKSRKKKINDRKVLSRLGPVQVGEWVLRHGAGNGKANIDID